MNTHPDSRRRPLIEELEPRLLYSADLALALPDGPAAAVEQRLLAADGEFVSQAGEQHSTRLEVVFIDTRVDNYQQLLDSIRNQNGDSRTLEVVLIDSEADGLVQVGDFLALQRNVDAIHLISHGSDGSVQLGSSSLDQDTLLKGAGQIQAWGDALSPDADILVYGCDVAAGTAGRTFIDGLAQLTGADVAASIDLSGSAFRGGDWQLEYRHGTIETALAIDAAGQLRWDGTLAAPTLDLDSNDSSGMGGADYAATHPITPGAVAITDIDARLADSDSATLGSLTVTIGNLRNGVDERLAADTTGTAITASYASATGVLTLSGTDSVVHYQQVLRTVSYQNAASSPDRTARTISFEASDGSATSNLGTATVNWTYALHQFNTPSYSENDGTKNWIGAWTEFNDGITDPTGGRVTVAGGMLDRAIPVLVSDTTLRGVQFGVNLSGVTDAALGFDYRLSGVSLAGNSTIQVDASSDGTTWATVFSTSPGGTLWSASPAIDLAPYASATTQIRLLSSSTAVLSVSASLQFDNMEVRFDRTGANPTLANTTASFTEDGPAVPVAPGPGTLNDADSANLVELVATLDNPLDGAAESLSANVAGTGIRASWDASTATLTLAGNDTLANYQRVLQTLSYYNSSNAPDPSARSITLRASDGVNHSNVATATVTVNPVNDAPNAAGDAASGMQATIIVGNVLANDSDPDGDPLTATLVAGPAMGLLILNPDGSFSYTPNLGFNGNDSFTYVASDGSLNSGVVTATLTVNPIGNLPSVPLPPAQPPVDPAPPGGAPVDPLSSSKPPVDPRPASTSPAEPALVVAGPAPLPTSPSSMAGPSAPDHEEGRAAQAAQHGKYETATTRLSQPLVNRHEEFSTPSQLDAWLTQLLSSNRVDGADSTLDSLVSTQVDIELTQDRNFDAAIHMEEAKISAVVFSTGAVWWGLRAGGLMASLLTSLPAWASLDVLPVLRDKEDGEVPWRPDENSGRTPRAGRPETPPDGIAE